MLIQKTVYFRKEDVPLWENVQNKAEWLHEHLNSSEGDYSLQDFKAGKPQDDLKSLAGANDVFKSIVPAENISPRASAFGGNFCKHGADPKFCKFAKNGKACK